MTYEEQFNKFYYPVCDLLKKHHINFVVHTAKEEEYRLHNNEYCCYIEMLNPYNPKCKYGLAIDDEIILYFNGDHSHIDIYEDDDVDEVVNELLETIEDVIKTDFFERL